MVARRILVVEDEPAIAELLIHVLVDGGYRVQHAANGRQAWHILCNCAPPDLLVTDVMMPGMDGVALIGKMRETARLLAVPILVLSALHKEEVRLRLPCLKAFLQKPFRVRKLMAKVGHLLQPRDVPSQLPP
jgi:DNA-binding response OmpR family regulator